MTRDDLTALIARVEAAAADEQPWAMLAVVDALNLPNDPHRRVVNMIYAECYESAALTLVPEGMVWNAGNDTPGWAHVWRDSPQYDGRPHDGRSATPALALTAAALRARLAQMGDDA